MRRWSARITAAILVFGVVACAGLLAAGGATGRSHAHTETVLPAPPEVVFPWLHEPEKMEQWVSGLDVEEVSPGPPAVGQRIRGVVREHERVQPFVSEITAFEPGRRLGIHLVADAFVVDSVWQLSPDPGGSRLVYDADVRFAGFLGWFAPLLTPMLNEVGARDLERLRGRLE